MKRLIDWFARNGVAANLLLITVAFAGLYALVFKIRFEVWPTIQSDKITIRMPYLGATPAEVEESVVVKIEEAIQDLEGIEELISSANEGGGSVVVDAETGYDTRELLDDIKNRVDAINTFPEETEKPTMDLGKTGGRVITVMISGALSERELRKLGEQVRDEISFLPDVTQTELKAVRPYEISIEVSENNLRKHNLSLDEVARKVRAFSIDLPAGGIKTDAGEVLLRTKGQAYVGKDFEAITLITHENGTKVKLGDVAKVVDGFESNPLFTHFNGKPAVAIDVFHIGNQNAIKIGQVVKDYLVTAQERMPEGVNINYWSDRTRVVKSRLNTLTRSAIFGGFLVFILLSLFLRFSLAIWVCIGIPISFLGALYLMPWFDVSINIISLFAFILVLGIVVDDAIVIGENVFTHLRRGGDPLEASIAGAQEVALPVTFGVLTTIIAFVPLTMLEGARSQIWAQIAIIVILVLCFSLVESKLVLPAHLKHCKNVGNDRFSKWNVLGLWQHKFSSGFERLVASVYKPLLRRASRNRYITAAIFIGLFMITIGWVASGRMRFFPFPRVASERVVVQLTMPLGTPEEVTDEHVKHMKKQAMTLKDALKEEFKVDVINHVVATMGGNPFGQWFSGGNVAGQSHLGEMVLELMKPEFRNKDITSMMVANRLRRMVGPIPGSVNLSFQAFIGGGGSAISVQLSGPNFDELVALAEGTKSRLATYPGVYDITDTFQDGKQEIQLKLKPAAETLGITLSDLARQVRHAFYGQEAQRIQRGRNEVRVMVRYPEDERKSLYNLEQMKIISPEGKDVPFSTVAEANIGRSFSSIRRVDRNRTINVTADINEKLNQINTVRADLVENFFPDLFAAHPTCSYTFAGEAREQDKTLTSLIVNLIFVLFAIYAMLAIAFSSYLQPLIVMLVIPFGLVGAVLGHLILGMTLSMLSIFGMLALMGVVINDSLVLVDYVNRKIKEGLSLHEAVYTSGTARFRPILLTSLTTFAGLTPLLAEKSTQAQFLKPMAVSLGFGVLFATFITLLLVPITYLIFEDIRKLIYRLYGLKLPAHVTSDEAV